MQNQKGYKMTSSPLKLSERIWLLRTELENKMDKGPNVSMTFDEALHMCASLINIEEDMKEVEAFIVPIRQQYMNAVSNPKVVELKTWKTNPSINRKKEINQ